MTTGEHPPNVLGRAWSWYTGTISALVLGLGRALGSLGSLTVRRTLAVTIASLIILIACAVGWLRFNIESDGSKLWAPQHTKAKDDEKWLKASFATTSKAAMFVASRKGSKPTTKDNVISLPAVWEIFQLDTKVRAMQVSKGGRTYSYSDLCYREQTGACLHDGFLNYWNMSFDTYLKSVGGSATAPDQGSTEALYRDINQLRFPDGKSASVLTYFGGVQLNANPISITGSKAVSVVYPLARNVSDSVATKWLNEYLDLLKAQAAVTKYTNIAYYSDTSVDNEISASVSKDLYLIGIAVVVFIAVAIASMSKLDRVGTRTSLAVVGLLSAILAMLAGYGLAMAFGLPFTTLQQTLPFILLGVSIDVMIILTHAYDESVLEDPTLTPAQRFTHLMSTAGLSVAVTTAASAVAFALGTITELPAITYFSAFATLSVACIFFSQVTFFIAIFIYTERRIAAARYDCLCCLTRPGGPLPDPSNIAIAVKPTSAPPAQSITAAATSTPASAPTPTKRKPGGLSRFFSNVYGRWLLWWPIRIAVVAAFLAYAIFSAWAVNQLREGQPTSELAPDDSYLQPFLKINEATFDKQTGPSVMLIWRDVDPSLPAVQGRMLASLNHTLSTNKYINVTVSAFQGNWLIELISYAARNNVTLTSDGSCFNPYANRTAITESIYAPLLDPVPIPGCIPQAAFYPTLDKFLLDPEFTSYKDNLQLDKNGRVLSSMVTLLQRSAVGQDKYERLALKALRDTEDQVVHRYFASETKAARRDAFLVFNYGLQYGEGLAILRWEAWFYIIMAVVGVGAVILLMLVHPLAALLLMAAIFLVDLFLFGEMYILDIRFNYVSIINMVMATGLAVDYSVYLAHKFMTTPGASRTERMIDALGTTGAAVFLGFLTSLAGCIPLAFSSSTILRTFFALLFGTVLFAVLVGLVLMPVIFATIGPAPLVTAAAPDAPQPKGQPYSGGQSDVELALNDQQNVSQYVTSR